MKNIKLITIILCAVLLVIGWFTVFKDTGATMIDYNNAIKAGDSFVAQGLYQRAILEYKNALTHKPTEENWAKMLAAYHKRYEESSDIMSEYIDELNNALKVYPKNVEFTKILSDLYLKTGDMESAYVCLNNAILAGVQDKNIAELKQELQYYGELNGNSFDEMKTLCDGAYTVKTNGLWSAVDTKGGNILNEFYYISPSGEGIRTYRFEKDTRLIRSDNFVLGIFEKAPVEAGVFSEGLIPAKVDNAYAYYNALAQKQFGQYEMASAFQNGKAAIMQSGKWVLIDNTGKEVSEKFADILLDSNGKYLNGDVMIAAKEVGKYQMFDGNGKLLNKFSATKIDLSTPYGWMAFEKDGKWGFVSKTGEIVIEPSFDGAKSFSCGLAAVCKDNKWGFINSAGKLVIDYRFSDADYFNADGSCMVKTGMELSETDKEMNAPKNGKWQLFILELGIR